MFSRVGIAMTIVVITASCGVWQRRSVRAEILRLEGGADRGIEIKPAKPKTIAGLSLYKVTILIPDHPGYRCAAYGSRVWCQGDMLSPAVKAKKLGSQAGQLNDTSWIDLVAFLTVTRPLATAGRADLLSGYLPPKLAATVSPPQVERDERGVRIGFYYEQVGYARHPSGPKSLVRMDFLITPDDVVVVNRQVVWDSGE